MGIDYGSKRIGVARADLETRIATPLKVLANTRSVIDEILMIMEENDVKMLVMGYSKDLQGKENPIADEIRCFVQSIQGKKAIEVVYENEFYTSVEARRAPGSGKIVDSSAASLILQSYLDKQL